MFRFGASLTAVSDPGQPQHPLYDTQSKSKSGRTNTSTTILRSWNENRRKKYVLFKVSYILEASMLECLRRNQCLNLDNAISIDQIYYTPVPSTSSLRNSTLEVYCAHCRSAFLPLCISVHTLQVLIHTSIAYR